MQSDSWTWWECCLVRVLYAKPIFFSTVFGMKRMFFSAACNILLSRIIPVVEPKSLYILRKRDGQIDPVKDRSAQLTHFHPEALYFGE